MKKKKIFTTSVKTLVLGILILSIGSCKKQSLTVEPSNKNVNVSFTPPSPVGKLHTLHFANHSTLHLVETTTGEFYMGGDIVLSKEQVNMLMNDTLKSKKSSLHLNSTFNTDFTKLWPNKTIYYTIDNPDNVSTINAAIAHWESNTAIRFVQRTNQANYVTFTCCPQNGNAAGDSEIGMKGGQQFIRLNGVVSLQTIIHEIGHTVGLFHEQQRADRDLYVYINYSNIKSSFTADYDTYIQNNKMGAETGPYDFNSVMGYDYYYSSVGYAGNTSPQIQPLNPNLPSYFFQGSGLSAGDIEGVRLMYTPIYVTYNITETVYEASEFVDNRDQEVSVNFWADAAHTIPGSPRSVDFIIYHTRDTGADQYNGPIHDILQWTPSRINIGDSYLYLGTMQQRMFYNQRMDLEPGSYYESMGLTQVH
ncbi:M12 family metallopeptidase [Mucilaginibacter boryungensis]|uniref:Peptidase M12A domain-containing protein n=1 Tax=Mucilaginibacter boryungensis TaxID=768480 RepID=A0ABR9XF26_9SPHI|nr:M12 family metallopeptidase [Mucilaginibacter boryungensis]MBE9665780.1 hypothetical protein [Mucilaginibacter boryungensis]